MSTIDQKIEEAFKEAKRKGLEEVNIQTIMLLADIKNRKNLERKLKKLEKKWKIVNRRRRETDYWWWNGTR